MGNSQGHHEEAVPTEAPVADTEMVAVDVDQTDKSPPRESPKYTMAHTENANGRSRAMTFTPTNPDNSPTVLTFSDLIVTTRVKNSKTLLKTLSGNITGGMWAIMGSSGSGKTTLLSTLSLRLDPRFMEIKGDFRLNGREYSRSVLKAMSAYVMQDDLLHGELTVFESLYYAAQLRMPPETTEEARLQRIDHVLNLMNIEYTRHALVGNARRKGISGGERKRVCVAMELLNHPKLLFLDEPTSGLDSTTAYSVCRALKNLSESGECTVVCTIHQPQPKIFFLFDNLILMKQGNIVYQGNLMKVVSYLEGIDKQCPADENLADHLLNITAIKEGDTDADLEDGKLRVPVDLTLGLEKDFYSQDGARSWFREYYILTHRCFKQYIRRWDIILLNLAATIIMAIFIGFGFWHHVGDQTKLIRPSVFFAMVNQGVVGSLQTIIAFPAERAIMLRERQAGAYQVSSYYLARTTCDIITTLWPPILFSAIVYHTVDYIDSGHKFGIYMLFCILDTYAATSLCTAVVCTCVSIERSTVVLSFLFEVTRLFGGYYTSPKQLHDFPNWKWADALSYLKYAYIGSVLNVLRKVPGYQATIDTYGYDEYSIDACIGYLIVLIVGFRFLGYLGLRFVKG